MKKIGIVTDSCGGISIEEANKLGIKILPMSFCFGEECFYENISITRKEFFEKLNLGEKVSTSQPAIKDVMNVWDEALEEYEQILHFPLSSALSGSCNTAKMLSQEDEYEGKVFVVDNGRIATPMHRTLLDALELIEEGFEAEKIVEILENSKDDMSIYIAVETLEFLKRGGRISAATAAIGTALNIKPILTIETTGIGSYKKSRGMKKARREMLEAIKNDLETKFKDYYDNNEVYMMAATSADEEATREWVKEIEEYFPGMEVLCDDLALAIACHTGEGALGVGFSCRPKR